MKVMKKIWTAIFAFIFTIALGLGISLSVNVTAKAATAQDVSLTWAAIHSENGEPTKYAFVLNEGITTPENYGFDVYFDGHRVPAYTIAGHNVIYVDYADFPSDVNDVHLFKMPAGTYYQSGQYTFSDCSLLLKNAGWDNGADRFDILTYERISDASFGFGLNMVDWALGANNNSAIYTAIEGGSVIPYGGNGSDENWNVQYASVGNAVFVNGVAANATIIKTHANEWSCMSIPAVANAGDTVTIDGWFYNADQNKAFRAEEVTFKFDGQAWSEVGVTQEYDLVLSTTVNGGDVNGIYASMAANDIPVNSDNAWAYTTYSCGNKGVLYNGSPISAPLHKFSVGDWYVNLSAVGVTAKAGDVVTVFGWFFCEVDGTQNHIKINPTTFTFDGTTWSQENAVISVSLNNTAVETQQIYVMPGESAAAISATATGSMLTNTTVTTVYENDAVKDGKFVLRDGESSSTYAVTFSVKDKNNVVYKKEMAVRVGFEDFVMENGAAVRTEKDSVNGLRFSAEMSADTYNNLTAKGATFGMVIVPKDYITEGYELTAANLFGVNAKYSATAAVGANQAVRRMLLLDNLTPANRDTDGNYEIYGAITDILTNNLTREFVGIAYVYVDETYILASYYGNEMENNMRSIYYVAQKAIDAGDNVGAVQTKYIDEFHNYVQDAGATYKVSYTVNYIKTANGMTTTETKTEKAGLNETITLNAEEFDGFTLTSAAMLTSKLYANKPNVFNFYYKDSSAPSYDSVAWYYPALDSSSGYDNAHNDAIAQTMKAAGFTTVNLAGKDNIYINSEANIEAMKQIIAMFNRNGLKSVVYTSNAAGNEAFGNKALPDFSDCAGFAGLLVWDEPLPTTAAMNRLAEYAVWFNEVYGESTEETPFMVNLFPSYASFTSGDYKSYSAYVKAYCDIVLSKVNGLKYLSTDTYPIMADGTLKENFLYDLAVLKAYGMDYDAFVHVCLQSSGWDEGNTTQAKAPTEEQMRLQLYTALAFGMDSVSWYTYSPSNDSITNQSPVDFAGNKNEAIYNAMQAVNGDIATIGSLYKTYDWKGVIMSSPAKGGLFGIGRDAQYDAYNKVKSEGVFAKYLLSASNTKNFSSVSGSGNYIIGVMEDKNGNEALTVVNYSAIKDNKALSLTLTGTETANYTIYVDGVAREVTIGTSGYTLNLQPGQGAFIVSADVKATVTFKNWDGTVLQSDKVAYGEMPVYTGETPTKEGYEFAGWSPALGKVTKDVTYTAQFAQNCTVTFVDYDGTVLETKSVLGGNKVEPATISNDPYIFKAWTKDGVAFDFNTPITEDITLVATWQILVEATNPTTEKIYTYTSAADLAITGSLNKSIGTRGDDWYDDDQGVNYDGYYSMVFDLGDGDYTATLTKINYSLYSEVSFGLYTGIAGTISISINGQTCSSFVSDGFYIIEINGRNLNIHHIDNPADVLLTATLTDAQYNGTEALTLNITESGWNCVQISHILGTQAYELKDVTFHTVTFTDYDGTVLEAKDVASGTAVEPITLTHDMYIFKAWTKDGVAFDFNTPITEDITLVATWQILVEATNPTTEKIYTFTSTSDSNVTTSARFETVQDKTDSWYRDDQEVLYGGFIQATFDTADGEGWIVLPKINYALYSEVSFAVYGLSNTQAVQIAINGSSATLDNSGGIYYVVEIHGKTLDLHQMNNSANVLFTATLTDAQYNGIEGLKIDVVENGWSCVQISHILGTQAYELKDVAFHTVTFTNMVGEDIVQSISTGNKVERPEDPTRPNCTFGGWYTEYGEEFDFDAGISEDTVIVAHWYTLVASVKPTEKIYTFTSTSDSNVTTSARFESVQNKADSWYQDDQMNAYGGFIQATFDTADGAGWIVLPKINYAFYSEVSFAVYGLSNTQAVQVGINGSSATLDNSGSIYYVVEIHGKTLDLHQMNNPANVLFTATLTDEQYNGTEGLKIDVIESGWSCVQVSHILGTQAYVLEEVTACNLTADSTEEEYVAYMQKVNNFTAYEKSLYVEPSIVATLRAKYAVAKKIYTYVSAEDLAVTGSLNKSIETKGDDWYQDDQGVNYDGYYNMVFDLADGDYIVTLTKINYSLYSEVSFGLYVGYPAGAAISVTINGQTCSTLDGYYVVEINGKNLNIHKMNEPENVLLTVTLTDAQYNGTEALTLNITESGWSNVQISHILGTLA